jgi:hypothetical protein
VGREATVAGPHDIRTATRAFTMMQEPRLAWLSPAGPCCSLLVQSPHTSWDVVFIMAVVCMQLRVTAYD